MSAFVLLLLASACVRAEPTLHQIVDMANKATRGDSSHARLTMTVKTPDWTRTMDIEAWNKDRNLAFIETLSPAKDKGNVTLRRGDQMWLWLEKVERVIKIPPTMMHSAWQGSDFTYEDIVKADSIVKDYTHKLLKKTTEKDRVVYEIEADPKADAPVVWGKVLLWAAWYHSPDHGDEAVALKEEDYSERGELIRTIDFSDIERMGGRLIPARMECRPTRKPGHATVVQYHQLDFDVKLSGRFFSLARLQRGVD